MQGNNTATNGKKDSGRENSGSRPESDIVFHLKAVTKHWSGEPGFSLTVPDLSIHRGEKVALVGFSGCGKSTLLDLLAMVLQPDQAETFLFSALGEKELDVMNCWQRKQLSRLAQARMLQLGYVLQTGGLFPFLSVRENIGISRRALGLPVNDTVEQMAKRLSIERHLDKLPRQLSVGERQRVAVARAMAHGPGIVIADEPTASLDPINANEIMNLFTSVVEENEVTLIMATHEWGTLDEHGFRRIKFGFEQDPDHGTVQASVIS